MIKLYVLIGMVEIFDKLMCSFGQDALDRYLNMKLYEVWTASTLHL